MFTCCYMPLSLTIHHHIDVCLSLSLEKNSSTNVNQNVVRRHKQKKTKKTQKTENTQKWNWIHVTSSTTSLYDKKKLYFPEWRKSARSWKFFSSCRSSSSSRCALPLRPLWCLQQTWFSKRGCRLIMGCSFFCQRRKTKTIGASWQNDTCRYFFKGLKTLIQGCYIRRVGTTFLVYTPWIIIMSRLCFFF